MTDVRLFQAAFGMHGARNALLQAFNMYGPEIRKSFHTFNHLVENCIHLRLLESTYPRAHIAVQAAEDQTLQQYINAITGQNIDFTAMQRILDDAVEKQWVGAVQRSSKGPTVLGM